ncbi:hypothetical protein [Sphingomonas pituitosa]|uniref:hypothetical protein n=1 Tax=Sphingomonas pituitosa TaxID=99597 RepID=UPI00082ADF05|nr:hypothetical protein [Sphingomonas pituitosa]
MLVEQDGVATQRQVYASPPSQSHSWSGEARVSRLLIDGPRKHLLTVNLRGRDNRSLYGDSVGVDLGTAALRETVDVAKPPVQFGAYTVDITRQRAGGISYGINWAGLGAATFGMQRTACTKDVALPDVGRIRGTSYEWLPSASAAVPLGKALSAYASYVKGLEDAGVAPSYAANANQLLLCDPDEPGRCRPPPQRQLCAAVRSQAVDRW